ncbi:MAG: sugar ABC transporter ATP-binding protein [Actinobacteria bacterium]|nr:sugar ABC transporter ATP-binding protein [Cyanobacteriota bacterium]MCL5772049.1 sugar ABC transporter ATP-binding protein [Actinomycetota bacterium]
MNNILNRKEKILDVKNITKEFPGVKALSDFNFDLNKGEVHCLIGENGAGKSTFIKILSGAFKPTRGEIHINNEKHYYLTPHLARKIGIQTVYQEDVLVPQITAAENIFLGSEIDNQKFFINYKKIIEQAESLASQLGINIKVSEVYEKLSPPDQQFVKILKALAQKPQILILDEPTQAFNVKDIGLIIQMVKRISSEGVSVIYIAHNLDEIIQVADRVTVLRDGIKINTHDKTAENLSTSILAKEMVGRPVELFYKKKESSIGDFVFEVRGLKLKSFSKEINFKVREGEILGIAGLKGAGRSEIARAIFGALKKYRGKVFYKNKDITPSNPIKAVREGLALLTEDKKIDGLFMGMPVDQNVTIVGLDMLGKIFINFIKEKKLSIDYINKLNIKTPSLDKEVRFLSGGNQQKVVLAKWLFKGVNVLIVDEPTHGIDVNAKIEVYELFTQLAASGKSIIMISSEMPELISLSDRVIVIRNFEISKELIGDEITEENILAGFMGGM